MWDERNFAPTHLDPLGSRCIDWNRNAASGSGSLPDRMFKTI
jgi:hypothetical protein